jgi:hypothetical protein
MTEGYSGGCQCGAVRFHAKAPLGKADFCHCRMCQKAFGSAGAALVSVPLGQLEWTRGEPALFRSSPIVARGFCSQCGTPLFMLEDGDQHCEIAAGAFDEPAKIGPFLSQVGVESRLPWFETLHRLPTARTEEQRTAEDMKKLRSLQHPDHDTENWPPT